MKPGNACEFVDARWCTPVPEEVRLAIETAFLENPRARQKFDSAPDKPRPAVSSICLKLTDGQAETYAARLATLPDRFTEAQLNAHLEGIESVLAAPGVATHVLYLFSYLWEISNAYEPLHFGPELRRYEAER